MKDEVAHFVVAEEVGICCLLGVPLGLPAPALLPPRAICCVLKLNHNMAENPASM
jgi:hypothetical protein